MDPDDGTTQSLQQCRDAHTTHATHSIESNLETLRPYGVNVDSRKSENRLEVAIDRRVIVLDAANSLPTNAGNRLAFGNAAKPTGGGCIQEEPIGANELHCIPLDGIVTRRENNTSAGTVVLDGELSGRCRHDPTLDDGASHGL
jgi:hypothetical protein